MLVLLTGATGLIGKEIGKRLIEEGHCLVVLARSAERARAQLPFPAKIIEWKNYEDAVPSGALDGVDAVIHLAGEPVGSGRWTEKRKKLILDSRVLGTRHLVEAVQNSQVKHFISASAIGIYGSRGGEELFEESANGADFLAIVSKAWESESTPLEARGVRVVHVRIGIVLSRKGGALDKLLPLFTLGLGGAIGQGTQWMSWIHLDDVVGIFLLALSNPQLKGALNAVAPRPVTNQELSQDLAQSMGRRLFMAVPGFALKTALGEMAQMVLGSQKVSSKKVESVGFQFKYPKIHTAFHEICGPLQDNQHEVFEEQWVPGKPEEVFKFFSDEKNLEELTPSFLGFKVVGKSTPEIMEGTLIDYRLSLHGVPLSWRTRIDEWVPSVRFVDTQLKGPYKKWHHTHEFIPFAGGTLIRDRVLYQIPVGRVGALAAGMKVKSDIAEIFAYRRKIIAQKFSSETAHPKRHD
jgi:uncharacterized protein (TIGR01777 family)